MIFLTNVNGLINAMQYLDNILQYFQKIIQIVQELKHLFLKYLKSHLNLIQKKKHNLIYDYFFFDNLIKINCDISSFIYIYNIC